MALSYKRTKPLSPNRPAEVSSVTWRPRTVNKIKILFIETLTFISSTLAVLDSTSALQILHKLTVFFKTIYKEIKYLLTKLFSKLFFRKDKQRKALEIYLVDFLVTHWRARSDLNFDPKFQFGADEALKLLQPFLSTY